MRYALVALGLVTTSFLSGCASHVELAAAPPSAPLRARLKSFDKLQSLSYHETTTVSYQYGTSRSTDYMQLADGTRVYYPEDVLPVVSGDSAAAKTAQASESKRDTATWLGLTALASVFGGLAVAIVPPVTSGGHSGSTPILVGLGISLVGGLGFGLAARFVGQSAQDEAASTYETYNRGLADRLNLCAREGGGEPVDCGR